MKIYNKDKTQILENPNQELGYLKEDVIVHHYPEIQAVAEDGHYETIATYPNGGKEVKWVVDNPGIEYQPARTEEEKIYVYVEYNESELAEIVVNKLRMKREPLLLAFDKYRSAVAYGILSETDASHEDIMTWYKAILKLDTNALENVPERINYYL